MDGDVFYLLPVHFGLGCFLRILRDGLEVRVHCYLIEFSYDKEYNNAQTYQLQRDSLLLPTKSG
jgi:hypothetical protein